MSHRRMILLSPPQSPGVNGVDGTDLSNGLGEQLQQPLKQQNLSRHPEVKWAQREDKIFGTVLLADTKDSKVDVEPEGVFKFSATAGADNHYELMLELLDKINVEIWT